LKAAVTVTGVQTCALPIFLDELASEYENRVRIAKINIDENQKLATEYGIRAIPTLLLFQNGEVADQIVGLRSKRDLKSSLDKVLVP
jgi:thioredoxin 1